MINHSTTQLLNDILVAIRPWVCYVIFGLMVKIWADVFK